VEPRPHQQSSVLAVERIYELCITRLTRLGVTRCTQLALEDETKPIGPIVVAAIGECKRKDRGRRTLPGLPISHNTNAKS